MQLDENGDQILCDVNLVAGRAFLGFASYNHGPISFEDLNSKLERADGATVDDLAHELVAVGNDSNYGSFRRSKKRLMPFAKLINTKGTNTLQRLIRKLV